MTLLHPFIRDSWNRDSCDHKQEDESGGLRHCGRPAREHEPEEVLEAHFDLRDRELKNPQLLVRVTGADPSDVTPVSVRNGKKLWCHEGKHEIADGAPVVFDGTFCEPLPKPRRYDLHTCLSHLSGKWPVALEKPEPRPRESPKQEDFVFCACCARPCVIYVRRRYSRRAPWVRNSKPRTNTWIGWLHFCSSVCEWRFHNKRRKQRRAEARAGRSCPECETRFDPPRSDAKFCSAACRMRAYRRRAAEEAPRRLEAAA